LCIQKKFFDFKHPAFYIKLIIAVIPALIAGVLLKKYIDSALDNLRFIASVMIGGGIILLFIDTLFKENTIKEEKTFLTPRHLSLVASRFFPCFFRDLAGVLQRLSEE